VVTGELESPKECTIMADFSSWFEIGTELPSGVGSESDFDSGCSACESDSESEMELGCTSEPKYRIIRL
jgi:hypothetical protein